MAFDGDVGPLKRRFLVITVKNKKLELPKKGKINKKVVDDAIELTTELLLTQASLMEDQIGNRIQDVSNTHIAKELKLVENELRWLKEIHLTSDSEEESSDEDFSYTAFVEGVLDIDSNRTATSSPLPAAHTALPADVEENDENKKELNEEPGTSKQAHEETTDTKHNQNQMNQALINTLAREETEAAVRWIEENQDTWLKKPHLVPLLDSSKEWEAMSLSKMMKGETSLANNGMTNLQH